MVHVHSAVDPADWDRLRRMIYRRAGYRCEACGATQDRQRGIRVEAHERFTYDPRAGIQRAGPAGLPMRVVARASGRQGAA